MCPCSPVDISLPDGPSGPAIPGFGVPFSLSLGDINPFPSGFPENLQDIFDKLQMLIPAGAFKPSLNRNFGKDIFDGIMKLLDNLFPFLMLYKFFLPVLNLIICIIEVLCALKNPFKLLRAIKKLFRNCLPDFLNLFPIFAIIIMLISLLLLLLALIEYIISEILKLIELIIRNIKALVNAFKEGNSNSAQAIANKLASILCLFQNLFVLLSLFAIIIQIIKDILSLTFGIPVCDDSDGDGCCTTDVCPAIVKNEYKRSTGTLKYLNAAYSVNQIPGLVGVDPAYSNLTISARNESWQLYDIDQEIEQKFINIVDGYDVTVSPKPVFFPTDVTYSPATPVKQAAYTVDLRLFYNPQSFGRTGVPRWIRFNDCIVTKAPTRSLSEYDNSIKTIDSGVFLLTGGYGFEDDGVTKLFGFADDGITQTSNQAQLQSFIHMKPYEASNPVLSPNDGYTFNGALIDSRIEYTFKPNIEVLLQKDLVTLGCAPEFSFSKNFINNTQSGDVGLKLVLLRDIVNSNDGNTFPDPNKTIECLNTAVDALRSNVTLNGAALFQATATICLEKLKSDTNTALNSLITLGFDACSSLFSINPKLQFTTKPIEVKVDLKERNKISLGTSLPASIGDNIAKKIKAYPTFGKVSDFTYDGYQYFKANLTSDVAGSGKIMISFDDNIFCTNTIPSNIDIDPTRTLQELDYQFIFTPSGQGFIPSVQVGTGDKSEGTSVRNDSDISTEGLIDPGGVAEGTE